MDNALVVTANQRVTEWLRSAGSVPEEAEEETIHFPHQKVTEIFQSIHWPSIFRLTDISITKLRMRMKPIAPPQGFFDELIRIFLD